MAIGKKIENWEYEAIGDKIQRMIRAKGLTAAEAAKLWHESLNLSESSAKQYISKARQGVLYSIENSPPRMRQVHITRLATILYLLGIREDDVIVMALKESIGSSFAYPRTNTPPPTYTPTPSPTSAYQPQPGGKSSETAGLTSDTPLEVKTTVALEDITEAEFPNILNHGDKPQEPDSSLTTPGPIGPDYSLTPEQARRKINLMQLGKSFGKNYELWATNFVRKAAITTERVGQQKLVRLEDVVRAAQQTGILTPAIFQSLLTQPAYQPRITQAVPDPAAHGAAPVEDAQDYTLTSEQAVRKISLTQLGKALDRLERVNSTYVFIANQLVRGRNIPTEIVGNQKLVRLEDVVNAAREMGKLTPEVYHALLSQEPYQPKPAVPIWQELVSRSAALSAVPVTAPQPVLPHHSQLTIRPAFKPSPPQAQQHSSYVTEPLPPYTLPLPELKIDFGHLPEGVSLYQYAAQLHMTGEGPFAGLEVKVAVYHPSAQEFVKEVKDGVRVVYHLSRNELGIITGMKKDPKSDKLTGISVDFKDKTMLLIVDAIAQNADTFAPKVWGLTGSLR